MKKVIRSLGQSLKVLLVLSGVLGLGAPTAYAEREIQGYEMSCVFGASTLHLDRGCDGDVMATWEEGQAVAGCDPGEELHEWDGNAVRVKIRLAGSCTLTLPPEWVLNAKGTVSSDSADGYFTAKATLKVRKDSTKGQCQVRWTQCGGVSGGNH